jgi:hypothetical protein
MNIDDNAEEDIETKVEMLISPAIAANWATMVLRQMQVATSVVYILSLDMKDAKTHFDKGIKVVEAVGILAVGIGPLWRKPMVSAAKLQSWKISPYQFTAAILTLSTVLVSLAAVFLFVVKNYFLVVIVVFVNSVLVNEIKWAEAYFSTNWLPKNKYLEMFEKSKNIILLFTIFPAMIATWIRTVWLFVPIPVALLLISYFLAFKLERLLDQQVKYKQMLEDNAEYTPLAEWNDPNSYDYYKIDIKQESWGQFYTYYFFQFL